MPNRGPFKCAMLEADPVAHKMTAEPLDTWLPFGTLPRAIKLT